MALVEILSVTVTDSVAEQLRGRNIEFPKAGSHFDGDAFHVVGWVLGRSSPVVTVEILRQGTVVQSSPLNVQRPDIVAAFPEIPSSEQSGFRTTVAVPDPGDNELIVQAVLQDESRILLGVIQVWRGRSGGEQDTESSVRDQSSLVPRFFRQLFYKGGG